MSWQKMTIDELAQFESAIGSKVIKINDIWWIKTKPFYFRPLFPFQEIFPGKKYYPVESWLCGVKHSVPEDAQANSNYNFLVYDELQDYSLENLDHSRRRQIKIGTKNFQIKSVESLEEMVQEGHKIYLSFYNRTKYPYRKDRVKKENFINWAEMIFRFPKIIVDGAYESGVLTGINISYMVKDVIFNATFFCNTGALKNKISDAMLHVIRERAAVTPGAKIIYEGMVTGENGHDEFKYRRGCRVFSKKSFYKLSPMALWLLKALNRKYQYYDKLIGYPLGNK